MPFARVVPQFLTGAVRAISALVRRRGGLDVLLLAAVVCSLGGAWQVSMAPRYDESDPLPSPAGIDRSGRSVGRIQRFASVYVSGIEYSTAAATILVDGVSRPQSALRIGQVVRVDGLRDENNVLGIASTVEYRSDIVGPVDARTGSATLRVLGQPVRVTADTIFAGFDTRDIAGVTPGSHVTISGLTAADGALVATRIDASDDTGVYTVAAVVGALDSGAHTFTLNALAVDYSGASVSGGALGNGAQVRVIGTLSGGVLYAQTVRVENGSLLADSGEAMDLEGLVTMFTSSSVFAVEGQPVNTTVGTRYKYGTAGDLREGVRVLVQGSVQAGVLVATRVVFKPESNIKIEGLVQSISPDGKRLQILGIPVALGVSTEFEDESALALAQFGPEDIAPGDPIEVRGVGTSGTVLASRVEREDPEGENEVAVLGSVTAIGANSVTVGGVTIALDARTKAYRVAGKQTTLETFLLKLRVGDIVKTNCSATLPLRAKKIEFLGRAGTPF